MAAAWDARERGACREADWRQRFDVIVTANLYGDIISDIAAQVAGSVGLAPSANIGPHGAMFEAVHGSAPDIAGQNIANPSGLLLAGVMMLKHIGEAKAAERVHNAWLRTIEDGIHTADIHVPDVSQDLVGTAEFADAVMARLGQAPQQLPAVQYDALPMVGIPELPVRKPQDKVLVGVDVFVQHDRDVAALAEAMNAVVHGAYGLSMITNRGVKVWPEGAPETFCTDHWRCRYLAEPGKQFEYSSNTSVILADIAARALAASDKPEARRKAVADYLQVRLFGPLGMTSMVPEFDASGTLIGGSLMHGTARDWARFGEFLRNRGAVAGAPCSCRWTSR